MRVDFLFVFHRTCIVRILGISFYLNSSVPIMKHNPAHKFSTTKPHFQYNPKSEHIKTKEKSMPCKVLAEHPLAYPLLFLRNRSNKQGTNKMRRKQLLHQQLLRFLIITSTSTTDSTPFIPHADDLVRAFLARFDCHGMLVCPFCFCLEHHALLPLAGILRARVRELERWRAGKFEKKLRLTAFVNVRVFVVTFTNLGRW